MVLGTARWNHFRPVESSSHEVNIGRYQADVRNHPQRLGCNGFPTATLRVVADLTQKCAYSNEMHWHSVKRYGNRSPEWRSWTLLVRACENRWSRMVSPTLATKLTVALAPVLCGRRRLRTDKDLYA